jgi:uncharacterized protein (DUF111 family)
VNLQTILVTGEVRGDERTELLEEALTVIESQVDQLREGKWGAMGEALLQRHEALRTQIQAILNHRRGLDGMTVLAQ